MNNKSLSFAAICLFFCCANAGAQSKTESVSKTRTVVNGKVTEDKTVYGTDGKNLHSKVISMEVPCAPNAAVYINNEYRKIQLKAAASNVLRMETVAYYTGNVNLTDAEWFGKLNIKIQGSNNLINITSGGVNVGAGSSTSYTAYEPYAPVPPMPPAALETSKIPKPPTPPKTTTTSSETVTTITITGKERTTSTIRSSGNSIAVYNEDGSMKSEKAGVERILILYVPAGADLHISSRYANVDIGFDAANLDVKITSASLDMQNAQTAKIDCSYGNIKAGNIKDALIMLTSGSLSAKDLGTADLNTKYSQVETGNCTTLKVSSNSDDYDLDEVKNFIVVKNYGGLKISRLTGSLDMKGTSADLKIKNIDPQVSLINIDNRYADLRLPAGDLKNYAIAFSGNYSNIYAPFSIKASPDESQNDARKSDTGKNDFTASQGDIKGAHTSFTIKCLSCSLDFK